MDTEKTVIESKNTLPYEGISYDDIPYKDPIDKFCGFYSNKNSKFSDTELAEKRFKVATSIMYVLSLLSILGGVVFYYAVGNNTIVLISGIIYLSFVFTFHKLRMPISLGILAIILLGDKIYTLLFLFPLPLYSLLFVGVALTIVIIQSFRSKKHLISTDKKSMQKLVLIFLSLGVIGLLIVGFGTLYVLQKDNGWSSKDTDAIKNMLYRDTMENPEFSKLDKQLLNEFATAYSECALQEVKKTFPNYTQFIFDLNAEPRSTTDKKFLDIKDQCFTKAQEVMLQTIPEELSIQN